LPTFASLQEFLRAQQAADMIGAKWGFCLVHRVLPLVRWAPDPIVRSLPLLD